VAAQETGRLIAVSATEKMIGSLQRVHAFDRRHPLWWDIAVASVVALISVNTTPRPWDLNLPAGMLGLSLVFIVGGALVFRRRTPAIALLTALTAVMVAVLSSALTGVPIPWIYLAIWVLLFNVGLRRGGRQIVGIAIIMGLTGLSALISPVDGITADSPERIRSLLIVTAMSAACYLGGLQIANRQESVLKQRQDTARTAVFAERSRIAQEMHDLVGHNLSVITSLANGGAVAARTAPEETVRVFEAIGGVSRSSVQEIRSMLAVLRHDYSDDGAPLSPQPGIAQIPEIVESMRAAGLRAKLTQTGDLRDLATGRQLAVYRIVQESLTNVLRHAGVATQVTVSIRRAHDGITVSVEDNGAQLDTGERDEPGGPGHGLIGMKERAEAYGGQLEAGACGTGWRVRAFIPTDT
jgi:signal transduction histidine kinase